METLGARSSGQGLRLILSCFRSLSGHSGSVNVVRYNHGTSKYCLSGGADRTIRLWNPSAGKEVKVYKGHGYEVLGIDM